MSEQLNGISGLLWLEPGELELFAMTVKLNQPSSTKVCVPLWLRFHST